MRTLTVAAALVAALPTAAVSSPVSGPSVRPALLRAADGQGVLIARGGGALRPSGGMGGGGMGNGSGGTGGGGMGGGGMGGGGMGSGGGGMGGFGGMMGSGFWGRGPGANSADPDSPSCGQAAHQSKNSKKARRGGTPRCDLEY